MATRKIAPALAAGCTVVVKPAELTPLTTLLRRAAPRGGGAARRRAERRADDEGRRAHRADPERPAPPQAELHRLDAGRVKRCCSRRRRTCCAPRWSSAATRRSSCSRTRTSTPRSRARCSRSSATSGEACTASNRFIVHESVADEFAERLTAKVAALPVGRGTEDGVAHRAAHQRGRGDEGRRPGAGRDRAAAPTCGIGGGPVDGPAPSTRRPCSTACDAGSDILRTEIFGPVVGDRAVLATEDDAVRHRERHRVRARLLRVHEGPRARAADDRAAARPG